MVQNFTTLSDEEFRDRYCASYAREVARRIAAGQDGIAGWYARQCATVAFQFTPELRDK